ncbi:MAG: hypothetical protein JXB34_12635 [Bacteroidales bacterium]|nr:hypothetical protein [Bacteroidales bacterium]
MKRILLVVLVLCAIHFWGSVRVPKHYYNLTDLFSLAVFGFSFVKQYSNKGLLFRNAIIVYFIGIFLNVLSAYFNNGQGPKDTILSAGNLYFILMYFWLHENKIERKDLETLIVVFAILYTIFYQMQIDAFPRRLFRGTLFADRGTIRLRMQGAGFMVLCYFMFLNRYLMYRKLPHILLAMFFLVIIIKGGNRTFLAATALLTGITFLKLVKYSPTNYFLILLGVIMFIGVLQMEETSMIIQNMIETTENQQEQGDRYIRRMQFEYFTNEYPQNASYYIFGGGFPGGYGSYANRMGYMVEAFGFYWVDLGLLGFYLVMGLLTTLGLLLWCVKGMFIRLTPENLYLNMYLAFLVLSSNIVIDEIFAPGIFGIQAITLYLIDLARRDYLEGKKPAVVLPEGASLAG